MSAIATTPDQIAQVITDIAVALRLIEHGDLEPAKEVLRFSIAELDDALASLKEYHLP
jgi:hypothetical protein